LDEGIADSKYAPYYIIIGITVIIDNKALYQKQKDIYCLYFGYNKFARVLRSIHEVYDLFRFANKRLVYDLLVVGNKRKKTEIQNKTDF
jgi:hypothetical protein